jgi:HK97 family phage portal protein
MARFTWPWTRRERFSDLSIGDPAFAAWLMGTSTTSEVVTPYTVLGLSAVLRAVSIISSTIAGLPLRTYEKDDAGERVRVPSVFDNPWPGIDGQTPFEWVETTLIHLLLWREAFLWHEDRDLRTGDVSAYRPINPDSFEPVTRVNGKRQFTYVDANHEKQTVGSEALTYIPGPSIDGTAGHPLLYAARAIFSAALSGDKAAQSTLARGIRIAGILSPEEGEEFDEAEAKEIVESVRGRVLGEENAGDVVFMNKHVKLTPWQQSNIDNQWHETRQDILGEVGRLFGIPPHLLNDIEKQTSWGTGVAEQNLGLARFTLMGWSSRIEQRLSLRLPPGQFVEFDYKGLLQGTPAEEIGLVIEQLNAGLISLDYACRVLNLPAPTAAQKALTAPPAPAPSPVPQEATA